MIRVDKWGEHDHARCGMGFRLDPGDGSGYAFLIHQFLNNMEYLNDHRAWKDNDTNPSVRCGRNRHLVLDEG